MAATKSARKGWVTTDLKLTGKTVLITGANTGIGLETAIDLAKRNARVIIACRNLQKAEAAKQRIVGESGSQNVIIKQLDLASFDSIRKLAEDINATEERLDILINNAGLISPTYEETQDGFEMHFGVNHLGPFLLTNLLLELLKRSAPSRIVTVASSGHQATTVNWKDPNRKNNFNGMEAYRQSKLMNVLFSRELSKRIEGTGVTSNSLHPGVVETDIGRDLGCCKISGIIACMTMCLFTACPCILVDSEKGAQTSVYCAIAPEIENITGKYFIDCKVAAEARHARNDESANKLWKMSEELTGL